MRKKCGGFSLVEVLVVLAIIGILGGLFVANITTGLLGDALTRGANLIYNDLTYMRMRAVSSNTRHRLRFASTTEWYIERYTGAAAPLDWQVITQAHRFPNNVSLTSASYANAGANLEAKANGLYDFTNGMTGSPFVTLQAYGSTSTRVLQVAQGGAITMESQ